MNRFTEGAKNVISYLGEKTPSFTTIPGFIFWTVSIYLFAWVATIVCGPLLVSAENDVRAR